jgi:hypothetical protein
MICAHYQIYLVMSTFDHPNNIYYSGDQMKKNEMGGACGT